MYFTESKASSASGSVPWVNLQHASQEGSVSFSGPFIHIKISIVDHMRDLSAPTAVFLQAKYELHMLNMPNSSTTARNLKLA